MSFTKNQNKAIRRQCDRCGKLAKDAEAGTYPRPHCPDGEIKSRGAPTVGHELCDECWTELQTNPRAT